MNDDTFQASMREATRLTLAGQLQQATSVIQQALGHPSRAGSVVLEGLVFEVPSGGALLRDKPPTDVAAFIAGTHTHAALTRHYKLYMPPGHEGKSLPLVVMLHGCTQHPDDFAAGTAMNERAFEQGFFVLYPAQAQDANPSRCWNWFKHNHQQRGRGEPALIADLVLTLIKRHGMDSSRVYVAGRHEKRYACQWLSRQVNGHGPGTEGGPACAPASTHHRVSRRPRPDGASSQW